MNKLKDTCDQIQDTGEQIQGYQWPIYDSWLYTCSELKDTGEQIEKYLWTHWEILVKDTLKQFKRPVNKLKHTTKGQYVLAR